MSNNVFSSELLIVNTNDISAFIDQHEEESRRLIGVTFPATDKEILHAADDVYMRIARGKQAGAKEKMQEIVQHVKISMDLLNILNCPPHTVDTTHLGKGLGKDFPICEECEGQGYRESPIKIFDYEFIGCSNCNSTGLVSLVKCSHCRGKGVKVTPNTFRKKKCPRCEDGFVKFKKPVKCNQCYNHPFGNGWKKVDEKVYRVDTYKCYACHGVGQKKPVEMMKNPVINKETANKIKGNSQDEK